MVRLQQEVMRRFREEDVGGRLVYSLTGSSPIAPKVLVFLRDALQAPTYEGYGSTEAGYVRPAVHLTNPLGRSAMFRCCVHEPMRGLQSCLKARLASTRLVCDNGFPSAGNPVVCGYRRSAADAPTTGL